MGESFCAIVPARRDYSLTVYLSVAMLERQSPRFDRELRKAHGNCVRYLCSSVFLFSTTRVGSISPECWPLHLKHVRLGIGFNTVGVGLRLHEVNFTAPHVIVDRSGSSMK